MRATLSRNGRKTTTRVARIRRSTTRHRRPLPPNSPQQAITLRSVMAPRAGLLLTPPERAYSCRDSNPRWGILQWQVNGADTQVEGPKRSEPVVVTFAHHLRTAKPTPYPTSA